MSSDYPDIVSRMITEDPDIMNEFRAPDTAEVDPEINEDLDDIFEDAEYLQLYDENIRKLDREIYRRRVYEGQSLQDISNMLNVPRYYVGSRMDAMRKAGIDIPNWNEIIDNLVYTKMVEQNKSIDQTAMEVGLPRRTIRRRVKQDKCIKAALLAKQNRDIRNEDYDIANKKYDTIKGGKAENRRPSDFNRAELTKGIRVELEHTDNIEMATEIAMDHLCEDPKYYTNLEKFHKD